MPGVCIAASVAGGPRGERRGPVLSGGFASQPLLTAKGTAPIRQALNPNP